MLNALIIFKTQQLLLDVPSTASSSHALHLVSYFNTLKSSLKVTEKFKA